MHQSNRTIQLSELTDIELDGIDLSDYPDMCDAHVSYARWKDTGIELTDEELERIDDGEVGELARQEVAEGDHDYNYYD